MRRSIKNIAVVGVDVFKCYEITTMATCVWSILINKANGTEEKLSFEAHLCSSECKGLTSDEITAHCCSTVKKKKKKKGCLIFEFLAAVLF